MIILRQHTGYWLRRRDVARLARVTTNVINSSLTAIEDVGLIAEDDAGNICWMGYQPGYSNLSGDGDSERDVLE